MIPFKEFYRQEIGRRGLTEESVVEGFRKVAEMAALEALKHVRVTPWMCVVNENGSIVLSFSPEEHARLYPEFADKRPDRIKSFNGA